LKPFIPIAAIAAIIFGFSLPGASQADTLKLNNLYKQAVVELEKLNFSQARQLSAEGLGLLKSDDPFSNRLQIKFHQLLGSMLRHEGKYLEAKESYFRALTVARSGFDYYSKEVALAYYHMAWIHEQMFDLENWKAYLDTTAMLFSRGLDKNDCWQGRLWQQKSRVNYFTFGKPDTTLSYLNKALAIYQTCPGGAPKNLFDLYKIYYDVYLSMRRFDSAHHYLQLQIDYTSTQTGPLWDIQRAWMQLSTAHLYRLDGQYEKAIPHYRYARTLFEKVDKDTVPLLNSDIYAAYCLTGLHQYAEALQLYRDLFKMKDHYSLLTTDMNGLIMEGAAKAFAISGRCDSAIYYGRQALDAFLNVLQPDNSKLLSLYSMLGKCLTEEHQYAEADSILDYAIGSSIQSLGPDHPTTMQLMLDKGYNAARQKDILEARKWYDELEAKNITSSPELSYRHKLLGIDIELWSLENSGKSVNSPVVFDLLQNGIRQFRNMRNQYLTEDSRTRSVAYAIEGLHKVMLSLYKGFTRQPDRMLFQLMVQLSETHRGIILSEAMAESEAVQLAGIPSALQSKERSIKYELRQVRKKIEQELMRSMQKKDYISQLHDKEIRLQNEFDSLISEFQNSYPAYYHAKFASNDIELDKIQRLLPNDAVIIEFLFVGDHLYTFLISHDHLHMASSMAGQEILTETKSLIDLVSNPDGGTSRMHQMEELSTSLFNHLIDPLYAYIEKGATLIIIPDKTLHYLPFEMLPIAQEPSSRCRFLVCQHPVQYQSSILLWLEQSGQKSASANQLLTIAPSFTPGPEYAISRVEMNPLSYASEEGKMIRHFWGGRYLTGERASKKNFIRYAPDSDIIHMATHASADDRTGLFSYLTFTPTTPDSVLYIDEIYGLDLDARMVVLSGCETGKGPLEGGEGLISLSRAFSYAGAESIITSLWPVHDEATSIIMTSFYQHLKDGVPKDEALRLAKIGYLERITDPQQADPYYWAAFIGMGDMSPLKISKPWQQPGWLIAACFSLLGIAAGARYYYKRRRIAA
jgi:CHAT domain-containing protein